MRTRYNLEFPHYLTKIIDARGNQVARNLYDELGRLIGIIDASGRTNRFEHDLANNREIQYDRSGQATQFKYDSRGNVLSVTDPLGHTNGFAYDANGYRLSSTDALGRTTFYTNDADGNVLSVVLPHPPGADSADYTTHLSYDEFGNQTSVQLPTGAVIANEYDANGNLTIVRDGESNVISSTIYDTNGLPTTETDRFASLNYTYVLNSTRQPSHAWCQRKVIWRWNSFSATNPSQRGKARLLKLNTQTPCPPRGAVPVNQGRAWEALSFWPFGIEFGNGCDRPVMSRLLMAKRPSACQSVRDPSVTDALNRDKETRQPKAGRNRPFGARRACGSKLRWLQIFARSGDPACRVRTHPMFGATRHNHSDRCGRGV